MVGIKNGGGDGLIIEPQHSIIPTIHHYAPRSVLVQHVATKANVDLVLDDVKACGHALLPDVHLRIVNSTCQQLVVKIHITISRERGKVLPRMAPPPRRKPGVPSFTPAQLPATKLKMLHLSAASYIHYDCINCYKNISSYVALLNCNCQMGLRWARWR